MNKKLKKQSGITLIALIITIIILVILAAISIRAVTNMGIVEHAINGSQSYAEQSKAENKMFFDLGKFLDKTILKVNGVSEGTGISLNKTSLGLQLKSGQTVSEQLTATLLNLPNEIVWTSLNPEVATVSNDGTVTAVAIGETTITAKVVFDETEYSASCEVNVTNIPVTKVELNMTSKTLEIGQTVTLEATVTPDTATNTEVIWESDTPSVATVENGVVTAVSGGTAIITATANDGSGYNATCTISVNIPVTGVTLNKEATTINVGSTETLIATIAPSNATNKGVTWSSNNTSVATVNSSGVVTGVSAGTATITVAANDGSGVTAICTVTVKQPVTGISLNKTATTINVGATDTLTATISPSNATNKGVTWSSNNTSVATVSSEGAITGVSEGTATITCAANDGSGKNGTCAVTVRIPQWEIVTDTGTTGLSVGDLIRPKIAAVASEQFYVIGIDGTGASQTVRLLARYCLDTTASVNAQDPAMGIYDESSYTIVGGVAFRTDWQAANANVYAASDIKGLVDTYSSKLTGAGLILEDVKTSERENPVAGVKGRLMWQSEAGGNADILYGPSTARLNYWLGSPSYNNSVRAWEVYGIEGSADDGTYVDSSRGVRPVIKVLASKIS